MTIKIACFSDTHRNHKQIDLPECDIALFGGDMSDVGELDQVVDFMDWYNDQWQVTAKIFIPGNHDISFDREKAWGGLRPQWLNDALDYRKHIQCLTHESTEVFGLKIFGSPYTPDFFPEYWAFNKSRGNRIWSKWQEIPDDTEILVVHGPAQGHFDWVPPTHYADSIYPSGHVGCHQLLARLEELPKLKLVVCGHIHNNYGVKDLYFNGHTVKYVNAAVVDNQNVLIHQPIIIELDV